MDQHSFGGRAPWRCEKFILKVLHQQNGRAGNVGRRHRRSGHGCVRTVRSVIGRIQAGAIADDIRFNPTIVRGAIARKTCHRNIAGVIGIAGYVADRPDDKRVLGNMLSTQTVVARTGIAIRGRGQGGPRVRHQIPARPRPANPTRVA